MLCSSYNFSLVRVILFISRTSCTLCLYGSLNFGWTHSWSPGWLLQYFSSEHSPTLCSTDNISPTTTAATTRTPTMAGKDKPLLNHILVTGAVGFVGSAIARAIAEQHPECRITVLDRNPPGSTHELPSHVAFIQGDITVPNDLHSALEQTKPQIVVHTAGIVPVLSERFGRRIQQLVWETNVGGTSNMLNAARHAGVKGFVYTSTCCVVIDDMSIPYRNIDERWPTPESSLIYGESKVTAISQKPLQSCTFC